MSDITISYKGNSIATMDATGTKTLLTEGKYCEDDIEVAYTKPSGGSVSITDTTDTAGGTIRTITATGATVPIPSSAIAKIILNGTTQIDLTQDTVAAANLISPNTAHGADGESVVGTASGGGSFYAEGTYTLASDAGSFSVDVDFAPKYAYALANWRELDHTAWKTTYVGGAITGSNNRVRIASRLNNGSYGTTGGLTNDAACSYSSGTGKVTFSTSGSFAMPAGATFAWFAAGDGSSS